ncbi:hypothetical protein WJX72_003732 [[Myrmecia] bisecta]|uniref:Gem-associated protein 5 TPR domain-containing protein n=1 Tax=[Myrmecia] bisecta TaxID=41462 RepID=A0AAW1PZW3_9CHLO
MSGVALPPSPNWYGAHLADWDSSGQLYAYAAHNSLVLLCPGDKRVEAILSEHTNRVTALCFAPRRDGRLLLLSGAADRCLRSWDADQHRALRVVRKQPAEVSGLAVSRTGDVAAVGDRQGNLFAWHFRDGKGKPRRLAQKLRSPVFCMAASPAADSQVAVGCEDGSTLLIDFASGQMLASLAAHQGEDRTLHVYDVRSEPAGAVKASLLCTLSLPKPPGALSKAQRMRLWMTAAWLPPSCQADPDFAWLVTSGYGGSTLAWQVPRQAGAAVAPPEASWKQAKVAWQVSGLGALASASDDGCVVVYPRETSPDQAPEDLFKLQAGAGAALALAWSPHHPDMLAFAAADCSVQVCRVGLDGGLQVIGRMLGHAGRVRSIAFHPTIPQVLLTGSEDQTKDRAAIPAPGGDEPQAGRGLKKLRKTPRMGAVSLLPVQAVTDDPTAHQAARQACLQYAARMLPSASAASAAGPAARAMPAELAALDVYVSPLAASAVLRDTAEAISTSGARNTEALRAAQQKAVVQMWRGDVAAALQAVIEADALNAGFVSMSVGAGRAVWREVVGAYAAQLEAQGDVHLAASHLLSAHDPRAAVEVYRRAGLLRDAITLASASLLPQDPLLRELHCLWASQLEEQGSFEAASANYLAGGSPGDAVVVMAKRGTLDALTAAARLAAQVCAPGGSFATPGLRRLGKNLALQAGRGLLAQGKFREAERVLSSWSGDEVAALEKALVALRGAATAIGAPDLRAALPPDLRLER